MVHSTGGMELLLQLTVLCVLTASATAILSTSQGRVVFSTDSGSLGVELFEVEGVATVQLGGNTPPSYFFDCNTTGSDSSGLVWSRQSGALNSAFTIERTTKRVRLNAVGLSYSDLDVYLCTDTNAAGPPSVSLNITASNPAICPVEPTYSTSQGLAVQLEVYVAGYPQIRGDQITWYRPDMTEILDSDASVQFANIRKTLILSNVQPSDSGTYLAEVAIPIIGSFFSRARTSIDLVVFVSPVVYVQPKNFTYVLERQSFSLTCSVSGKPQPSITWEREDGTPIPPQAEITSSPINPDDFIVNVTSTLSVQAALYADIGRYRCVATNGQTPQPVVSEYAEVTVSPDLLLTAEDTDANQPITFTDLISQSEGSRFTVECLGSGNLLWTRSTGSQIPTTMTGNLYQLYDLTRGALTLHFINFNASEVAVYTCATHLLNPNNQPIAKDVLITNSNPAVFISPTVQYVLEGGTVAIEAGVYSSSNPTVQWYLEGQLLNIDSDPRLTVTQDDPLYILTVSNVDSSLLGEYSVMVTLNTQTVSDSVNVAYLTPPTVSVSPSTITVENGDMARIRCQADGTGVVNTVWLFDGSPSLPSGVQQNVSELVITMITSIHAGAYSCRVSNSAGTVSDTAQITVVYTPTSVVGYDQLSSTSNQYLLAPFVHGVRAPTFTCTSDGFPAPQITWRVAGGTGEFPNGVTMQEQLGGGAVQELTWQRPLEYTDSGQYECVSVNAQGTSIATLELFIQFRPIINSIYPSTPVQAASMSGTYLVPTGHTGIALTCGTFGWPPPHVEWIFNNGPLPNGVVYDLTNNVGIVSARLSWVRGFNSSDVGEYQCVVKESNTTSPIAFKNIQIIETGVTTIPPTSTCTVSDSLVHFQVRVLDTDCVQWGDSLKESIAGAFQDEIVRIIESQCSDCQVSQSTVQTLGLPACSSIKENGVVFRGTIETDKAAQTESIYCALSEWQQTAPLININANLFKVDSGCALRVDSFSSPECVPATGPLDMILIISIAVPVGAVLIIIVVIIILLCCVGCYCTRKRNGKWGPKGRDPYSRTEPRYGPHGHLVGPVNDGQGSPMYASLERTYNPNNATMFPAPPLPPNNLNGPLPVRIHHEPRRSISRDKLLSPESTDGVHVMNTDIDNPTPSTGNMDSVGISFVSSSSSSRARGPVISATNPIPDYEQLDHNYRGSPTNPPTRMSRMSSFGESSTSRKFSSGDGSPLSPNSLAGGGSYSILEKEEMMSNSSNPRSSISSLPQGRASGSSVRNFSRTSLDPQSASPVGSNNFSSIVKLPELPPTPPAEEDNSHGSNCSEEPPPYSSRPPSELTPAQSMQECNAYSGFGASSEQGRQWYLNNSDFSLDSEKSRQDLRGSNGRTEIVPYAMIHNSAIPYTVPIEPVQTRPGSGVPPPTRAPLFQITNRRESTPQPYSEPVLRSSMASITTEGSYTDSRESPNFQTVAV